MKVARSRLVDGMERTVSGAVSRTVHEAVRWAIDQVMGRAVSNLPSPAFHETLSQIAGRDVGDSTLLRHGR